MIIIGENFMDKEATVHSPEARSRFKYPRSYGPSTGRNIVWMIVVIAVLFVPFAMSNDKDMRLFFTGFVVLVDIATVLYAFGSKLTLYNDKIEYQRCFIFKRLVPREQLRNWQLQVTYIKNAEIFSLVLDKRWVIEINFEMDSAFCAWFPHLQTLVQDNRMQFPGLQRISK